MALWLPSLNQRRACRHPSWVALAHGSTRARSLALDVRPSKMSVRPMDATIVKISAMALTPVGAAEPKGVTPPPLGDAPAVQGIVVIGTPSRRPL